MIADFGLSAGAVGGAPSDLTATGQLIGTPSYMALEQLRGQPATALSDQFAWCVCVWEALVGTRPFRSHRTVASQAVALLEVPRPPRDGDRHVLRVLARGLDPVPHRRWRDLDQLVEALGRRGWWTRWLAR